MPLPDHVFADRPETILREHAAANARDVNHVLLGTFLEVLEESGSFYRVATSRAGPGGWVAKAEVSSAAPLKVFFVDVGQGDGALIESPQGIAVVDGGQDSSFHHFLRHRYAPLIDAGERVRIEALFVSHPDSDHYKGLEPILKDEDFAVGTIYHNGLMRYASSIEESRTRMLQIGHLVERELAGKDAYFVVDLIDTLNDAVARLADMPAWFREFWQAADAARSAGRLVGAQRLTAGDSIAGFESKTGGKLKIAAVGPVPHLIAGKDAFLAFDEPPRRDGSKPTYPHFGYSHSHTRNGHSLVLRLEFGNHKVLLGGDLNIPAEQHLLDHYGSSNPFRVDVAKACHHGSSDFSPEFLEKVKPYGAVISSGDNKSFDHPTADALGAVARYTRGDLPVLFSTELARAVEISSSGQLTNVHYGLTNLRSNGTVLTMAQMKEQHAGLADVWDSYVVPWSGKFWYERS